MSDKFREVVEKLLSAPTSEVFESAMSLFHSIDHMNEEEVVAFWRTARMFWEISGEPKPNPVVRQLLEAAWARMQYLRSYNMDETPLVLIEQVVAEYRAQAA